MRHAPSIALVSIARPTFDVALAQQTADSVLRGMEAAGCMVGATRNELMMDAAAAERATEAVCGEQFDVLVLLQASFADASLAVGLAQVAASKRTPILLWAVPDERIGGRLRLNSLCGINLAGHAFSRRGIRYEYVFAPSDSAVALESVVATARASQAMRALQGSRIGVVGQRPAGFDTCDYDSADLMKLFGVEVVAFPLEQVLARAAHAGAVERDQFLQRVGRTVRNLDELDAGATAGTAGVYCALADLAHGQELNGVAVRCWPEFFTELGCAACGAMSMLNEEMCPAACEADANGVVTSLLLQGLSRTPAFISDLVSIDSADDTGVLWHCGLAPVSMADADAEVRGTIHSNRKLPLLFEFALRAGRVTLARLHRTASDDEDSRYELVIGGGEVLARPRSFDGTCGVVRFDRPAHAVLDTVMRLGLEHHFCMTYGEHRQALRAFGRLVELPVVELC